MARTWGGTLARKITEQSNIAADLRPQTGLAALTNGKTAAAITGVRITNDTTFHFTLRAPINHSSCQYAATDIVPGEVGTAEFNITGYKADGTQDADDDSEVTWMLIS